MARTPPAPPQIQAGEQERVTLAELRRGVRLTQVDLAERMGISQRAISHVEHEPNPRVATLAAHVRALGGRLQLRVAFEHRVVELDLAEARPAAANGQRAPAARDSVPRDRPDASTP